MDTILTVKNGDLQRLDAREAVAFFRDLIWAEAKRIGIPLCNINISVEINTPDQGVDASVSEAAPNDKSGLIRAGHNSYQIKTGSTFTPWQASQIKRELFGRKQAKRENLGERVRACLDANGIYVLVCFGRDLTGAQRQDAFSHLTLFFNQCGYPHANVDVWSLNNLIGFVQPFLSLALRVNGHQPGPFQTHQEWQNQGDMAQVFVTSEPQERFVSELRAYLRDQSLSGHVRVWGESGVGKTRLVLEGTNADDLRPFVVYCDAALFRDNPLMGELLREDYHAILVLDDCDPENRAFIWNKLKNRSPALTVVSICSENDDASGILYVEAPRLDAKQISTIIQQYDVAPYRADRWADWCGCSPKVAHVIGENLRDHPEDLLKTPGIVNVWDRYVAGEDDPKSPQARERRLVLQNLALYKRFGFDGGFEQESRAIASRIAEADPQITWSRFCEIICGLRKKKILQGQKTLYITPKLLHVKLWTEWWENHDCRFDLNDLAFLPSPLRQGFFEMFEYVAGSPLASRIVRAFFRQDYFRPDGEALKDRERAQHFMYLAACEPESALRYLRNTLGKWTDKELLQFDEARPAIVRALASIAFRQDLFAYAAQLLLALGEFENAPYPNNASGTFAGLFRLPLDSRVSPTQASPRERLRIIQEAFESGSKARRGLAVRACEAALTHHGVEMIPASQRVLGKSPEPWMPKIYGELFEAYRQIWHSLVDQLEHLSGDERQDVIDVIFRNARALARINHLSPMVVQTIRSLMDKGVDKRAAAIETAIHILHYDSPHLTDQAVRDWEALRDELTGTDFHLLLLRFVGMNLIEDRLSGDGTPIDVTKAKIEDLATQAICALNLVQAELGWLVSTKSANGYLFGYELAKRDGSFQLLDSILSAQGNADHPRSNAFFLGGYLRFMAESDWSQWEDLMDILSLRPDLVVWVPEMTWRSGRLTDRAALRLLEIIQKEHADVRELQMFAYRNVLAELSPETIDRIVSYLLDKSDATSTQLALALHTAYYVKDARSIIPECLTLRLLNHPCLFSEVQDAPLDQMASYHWQQLSRAFLSVYPGRSRELAETILEQLGSFGGILDWHSSGVKAIIAASARQFPEDIWRQLERHLNTTDIIAELFIRPWLQGDTWETEPGRSSEPDALSLFPADLIWQWVDSDVEEHAPYLATLVPKRLFDENSTTCWARQLLIRYGDREDVRSRLIGNFSAEGGRDPKACISKRKGRRSSDSVS